MSYEHYALFYYCLLNSIWLLLMKNDYKQNKVSQAVWPWHTPCTTRQIKRQALPKALLTLTVAWTIAGFFLYLSYLPMSWLIIVVSSFIFCVSQFSPSLFARIESVFQKLAYYIGQFITHICLVPFFYLCFTAVRLIQIARKTDPMTRKYNPGAASYWVDNKAKSGKDTYRRQF